MLARTMRLPILPRHLAARLIALLSLAWLAACDVPPMQTGPGSGQRIDPGAPVQVALLLPGSSNPEMARISSSLENAARMAASELDGARIDLRVYTTNRDPQTAAAMANRAVRDGAGIILGPLDAQSAISAGNAVAGANVNVLAFSNNPVVTETTGSNTFILGRTFANTAQRLVSHTMREGITRYAVVHQDDIAGQAGRDAIARTVRTSGGTVSTIRSYPFSQSGIFEAAPAITDAVRGSGAGAIFVTDTVQGGLSLMATSMVDRGVDPVQTPFIGLTDWSVTGQAATLPPLQNGYFARPDANLARQFETRYTAAYGSPPHRLASIAHDGIAAIGSLVASGDAAALTTASLTRRSGFVGATGIFRLNPDGTNDRALAVARIQNNQVVVVDPAPNRFGIGGS
ncbi:penicillin-binding protein activator [Salibaculum sp.]|uniref:penicillin-binding protein activator n=1 Tax=Salibaculum sp. TaxID=2855480 RepID=UPI002B4973D7|nr:penicillin-binding protein activator [Salibaculum sp.]HKL68209.1 penicillin-binding protein activator [Salibaculum sp.]